eukprot:10249775-Alexandrium_andersonii.AAC.1
MSFASSCRATADVWTHMALGLCDDGFKKYMSDRPTGSRSSTPLQAIATARAGSEPLPKTSLAAGAAESATQLLSPTMAVTDPRSATSDGG